MEYLCLILFSLLGLNIYECKGEYLCDRIIPNGRVALWCRDGRSCQYFCAEDFEANVYIPLITCSSTGQWVPDFTPGSFTEDDFCKRKIATTSISAEIRCPSEVRSGKLWGGCSRLPNSTCVFSCDRGCYSRSSILNCDENGNWVADEIGCHCYIEATLLSQSRSKCPIEIPNGHVSSYCSRLRYSQCVQYSCSENCVSVGSMIYCNGSGFWENAESACFCYERPKDVTKSTMISKCPATIPNGRISEYCDRSRYSWCPFKCYDNCFSPAFFLPKLYCTGKGYWDSGHAACRNCMATTTKAIPTQATQCSLWIPSGYISAECSRLPYSSCNYTCYSGCHKTRTHLNCAFYGNWYGEDKACRCIEPSTSRPSRTCPSTIPNGLISYGCDRSLMSYCTFTCIERCPPTVDSLYCDRDGTWEDEIDACKCPITYDIPTVSPSSSSGMHAAVAAGCVSGVVVLLAIVGVLVGIIRHRKKQGRATARASNVALYQRNGENGHNQRPNDVISPNNGVLTGVASPIYTLSGSAILAARQNSTPQHPDHDHRSIGVPPPTGAPGTGPPDYSTLSPVNDGSSPPAYHTLAIKYEDPPPSYEEIAAHP